MVNVYACVQPDGTEWIVNEKPRRYREWAYENATAAYCEKHPIPENKNEWVNSIFDTDYGYCGYDYSFDAVELPEGTIKKLTGIKIDWNCEPILLNAWLKA